MSRPTEVEPDRIALWLKPVSEIKPEELTLIEWKWRTERAEQLLIEERNHTTHLELDSIQREKRLREDRDYAFRLIHNCLLVMRDSFFKRNVTKWLEDKLEETKVKL